VRKSWSTYGLLRNRSSKSRVNTLGCSVKNRKTTPAYPARVYISVRTSCFPIFTDTPKHMRSSCRIRVSSLQVHQHQEETQLQCGDPSSMIGLFNIIREVITCSHNSAAISLSMASEVITPEDKAIHLMVVFRSKEQGVVAMTRTIVGFGVQKRKE